MQVPDKIGSALGRTAWSRRASGWHPIIPGLEVRRLDNIFFAVCPTEGAANQIHGIARSICDESGLRGRLLDKSCLHVTMHGVGEYEGLPRCKIAQAIEAAGSVSMAALEISFNRAMSFSGGQRRSLVLCAAYGQAELRRLHRLPGDAMRKAGLWRTVRSSFAPHVTLLYDSRIVAERSVPPVRWTVREFVLIHSPQGHSRHHHLGRLTLCG